MMTAILLLVLFVSIYLLWASGRQARRQLTEDLDTLRKRIVQLEARLLELDTHEPAPAGKEVLDKPAKAPPTPIPVSITAPPTASSPLDRTAQRVKVSQHGASQTTPLRAELTTPPVMETGTHQVKTDAIPTAQPTAGIATGQKEPSAAVQPPKPEDWEATLGGKWLHKIGITVLVIGLSFMLAYAFEAFGAWGKCGIAYLVSLVLFLAGTKLEKIEKYRIYAWSLLGGAWAAGYFTTYSLHFVDAIGIVQSEWVGLLLLAFYTTALIFYSFRFRSQVVTALASGIGYATIALSGIEAFSMTAILLLSLFLVLTGIRMNWSYIPMLGIIGTYGLHISWEAPLTTTAPWWTVILIAVYWAVFLIPTFSNKLRPVDDQRVGLIGTGFNGLGLIACLGAHYGESTELFFSLLLAGLAYAVLTILCRVWLHERLLHLVLATMAAGILFLSIPIYFSGDTLLLIWLFEAEFLLILGVMAKDAYFKQLSLLGLVISSLAVLGVGADGATVMAVAAVHYLNWYCIDHRAAVPFKVGEVQLFTVLAYAGGVLAAYALSIWFPGSELAFAWLALCIALMASGVALPSVHLRVQSMLIMLPTLMPILESYRDPNPSTFTLTALGFAAFAYSVAWFCHSLVPRAHKDEYLFLKAFGFPATLMLGLLLAKHVSQPWLPVSGLMAAAGLLFVGLHLKAVSTRLQGYIAVAASFLTFFVYTLEGPHPHSNPVVSWLTAALLIVGMYGISVSLRRERTAQRLLAAEGLSVEVVSYLGMLSTAVFTYREVPDAWVPVVWIGGAVASLLVTLYSGYSHYAHKAYVLMAAATLRTAVVNLFPLDGPADKVPSVLIYILLAVTFYGILMWAHRHQRRLADDDSVKLDFLARPVSAIALTVILVVMTFQETSLGILTVFWAVEGLSLFVAGLLLRGRELRLSGVALLGICILKVAFIDVAAMETLNRIFSFIALGLALIAVSYLYVRFSEAIRRYL